jgi:hypothetical protein
MSENRIGLAELCEHVKQELMTPTSAEHAPLLSVEEVMIEMQVTAVREGKAGIKLYIAEIGAGEKLDETQKVTVTLKPLLDHEERLKYLAEKHPETLERAREQSVVLYKGAGDIGVEMDQ